MERVVLNDFQLQNLVKKGLLARKPGLGEVVVSDGESYSIVAADTGAPIEKDVPLRPDQLPPPELRKMQPVDEVVEEELEVEVELEEPAPAPRQLYGEDLND